MNEEGTMKKSFHKRIKDYLRVPFLQNHRRSASHTRVDSYPDRRAFLDGLFDFLDSFDFSKGCFLSLFSNLLHAAELLFLRGFIFYTLFVIFLFHFTPRLLIGNLSPRCFLQLQPYHTSAFVTTFAEVYFGILQKSKNTYAL